MVHGLEEIRRMNNENTSQDFGCRVGEWAEARNIIHGTSPGKQLKKLLEEVGELAAAIATGDLEEAKDGIGDTAVVLAVIAKQLGLRFEGCCEHAWNEIKNRKGRIVGGVFVKEADLTSAQCEEGCIDPVVCDINKKCTRDSK